MEKEKNTHPVVGDIAEKAPLDDLPLAEETEDVDEEDGDDAQEALTPAEQTRLKREKWADFLTRMLILARYLLPALSALLLLAFSFADQVYFFMEGRLCFDDLFTFYKSSLEHAFDYWTAGAADAQKDWIYGVLTAAAAVGILSYLGAAFFAAWGAVTAVIAFRHGHESEESNRMKLIFKVAFPNRLGLFLPELLILLPAAYPYLYSFVSSRFLMMGGETVIYVFSNPPLIVVGAMLVVSLALALAIPRYERRKKMNMFLLWHEDDPSEEKE